MRPDRPPVALLLLILIGALLMPARASAQSFCDFAPRLTTQGIRAAVGVAASVEVTVIDPNGDAILSLTADTSALPPGNNAVFTTNASNTAGTLTWTPQTGQAGSYSVSFTAANALSASANASISVTDTGGAPFVQCPSFLSTPEGSRLTFDVFAGDPDGEPITSLTVSPAPTGLTFTTSPDNSVGTFDWQTGFTSGGSWSFTFTATSSTSASYATLVTVTLSDRAPVVFAPPSATGLVNSPLTICVSAADPDGDAIMSLTASPLPTGATFTSSASHLAGTFSWTPTNTQAGTYTVFFTASNALSGSASVPITIQGGSDTPPVVVAPASETVAVGSNLTFTVTATDPTGQPITSLTASNLPAGATFLPNFDNTVGTFSWTPAAGQGGTYFVLFTAANELAGTATTAINVTGEDLAARVFTTGGNSTIRLGSGKARWCANVEPVGGDFSIADVLPTSIVMLSSGTGTVSQIPAIQGKGITAGDADKNTIEDFEVCFSKDDLRQLFSLVSGRATETVAIRGDLANGSRFQGSLTIDVVGQGGPNGVAVLPNPPNPGAAIRFTTSQPGAVRARVFDIRGRLVRTIESGGDQAAGDHALRFDGLGDSGKPLPTGIYLFRVETADGELTTKAAIVR